MKCRINKNDIMILAVQLMLAAVFIIGIPYFNKGIDHTVDLGVLFFMSIPWTLPIILVYFTNFYCFIPRLYERKRYVLFVIVNILLIPLLNLHLFGIHISIASIDNVYVHAGLNLFVTVSMIMNIFMVGLALGIRYIMRANRMEMQLKEIKQKNAEAELAWLRNQLNPHFLFNALNNISSLTQIDPDKAQDSIAQLSDLLRYAMYDTRNEKVPLSKDVDFMDNYIAMMRLRCSEKTTVTTSFNIENPEIEIAPMLFISLVENAFKHGTSNTNDSFVNIELTQKGNELTFCCRNSDFHKTDADRSGKGVGLENTQRRLELIYPDRFTWKQDVTDGVYETEIKINLK